MNIRSIVAVAAASAFVALSVGPAVAQEATKPPPKEATKSTQSREKVREEVKDAKTAGTLDRSGEAKPMPQARRGTSNTSRAEVRDKVKGARADGTLDTSGEAAKPPTARRRAAPAKEMPDTKG
jgi:hypothetical protein